MVKVRKEFLLLAGIILIVVLVEVLVFNHRFIIDQFFRPHEQRLRIQDGTLFQMEIQNGKLISQGPGANIKFNNINVPVDRVSITCQNSKAPERPQVYDCGSAVKFDPAEPSKYPFDVVYHKLESLYGKTWDHNLGDGMASQRVVDDLFQRLRTDQLQGHRPEDYHVDIRRSYIEDGLAMPNI